MVVSNHYETLLVLQSTLSEETRTGLVDKIKAIIEKDGTLEKVDLWGNRRLAYPIDYKTEGYYVVIQFISNPELPKELDRVYRITDGILRSIIIKRDERYLDVQVKLDSKAAVKAVDSSQLTVVSEQVEEEVIASTESAKQSSDLEEPVVETAAEPIEEPKPKTRKPRAKKVEEEAPIEAPVGENSVLPQADEQQEPTTETTEEEPKPKTRKPRAKKVIEEEVETLVEAPVGARLGEPAEEEPTEPIAEEATKEGEEDAE